MKSLFPLLALLIFAPGCTLSVHPVLKKADLSQDVDLSGTWKQRQPSSTDPKWQPMVITCQGYEDHSVYDATYQTGGGQEFELKVGKIDGKHYVQLIRSDLTLEKEHPILSRVPVYGFARFELKEKNKLHVFPLVHDRDVRKMLQQEKVPYLEYEPSDMLEWCIITAPTAQLQQLIRNKGNELFEKKPIIFDRIKPDKQQP